MLLDTLHFLIIVGWAIFVLVLLALFIFNLKFGLRVAVQRVFSVRMLPPILLVLLITLASFSMVFVRPSQVGVVVSLLYPEGYQSEPFRSGVRLIVPLAETVVYYPISWSTYTMSAGSVEDGTRGGDAIVARTADGQEISLDCTLIYRIQVDNVLRVHLEWQDRYEADFIRPMLRSMVRTLVSQYTVDEVNSSKRLRLESELDNQLKVAFEEKGFEMDRFLLRNVTFSKQYADAVERKQIALQEQIMKEYEAEQLRRYAKGEADSKAIIAEGNARSYELEAEGRSKAMLLEGQAQADVLKTISRSLGNNKLLVDYFYVEKLSPALKVMLLPSNSPIMLPLSDLLNEVNSPLAAPLEVTPISPPAASPTARPTTLVTPAPAQTLQP